MHLRGYHFNARRYMLLLLSQFCLSVCLSVHHTGAVRLNGLRYQNISYVQQSDGCSFLALNFVVVSSWVQSERVRIRSPLTKAIIPVLRINPERCKIECDRKSRTGFRLVPKLVTLNDLARCHRRYIGICPTNVLFEPTTSNQLKLHVDP